MSEQLDIPLVNKALENTKVKLKTIINNDGFWNEFITTLKLSNIDQNKIVLDVKNLFAKQILSTDF
ncbi:MAG: hypothetical protein LBD63_01380, partial [Mycoplasmataceae bacterium]|nr:hypothetical protein [Mycoplasmataceae bacterium]